jgi:aryl sulfotransferase
MPTRPALRDYRTWIIDSRRWAHYRPRGDDIVIATYPKCGTTWMQRIVSLLVFQSTEPVPVMNISPWIDRRIPEPIEAVIGTIEAQKHRRFLKSHLPADGLPIFDEVQYIHVARDGRDACISFHNHGTGFTDQLLEAVDQVGREDETLGRPYPRVPEDPGVHFHKWLTQGEVPGHADGSPAMSFFQFERSWWDLRDRDNVLLVHYNDLKADLAGEMTRVAAFLNIEVPSAILPGLVKAASFDAMRRDGNTLMGKVATTFRGGGERFFFKGTNRRWHGVYSDDDLALYEAKLAALPTDLRAWIEHGRLDRG